MCKGAYFRCAQAGDRVWSIVATAPLIYIEGAYLANVSLSLNGTARADNTTFWQGYLVGSAGISGNSGIALMAL